MPLNHLLIFGDDYGVPELLGYVPSDLVAAIIAAANRPQYHEALRQIAKRIGVTFLVQPKVSEIKAYNDFLRALKDLSPDGLLSHSYSMLIQSDVLRLVEGRAFNIHASLLPRNRGPNPVQWALIHGEDATGVTLHVMDEGIDSGAIVDQEEVEISEKDTWVTLLERVKSATQRLMDRALPRLINGDWDECPQDLSQAITNQRITQESFAIDFSNMTDLQIFNLIRAQVSPLAGAYLDGSTGRRRFPEYLTMDQVAEIRRENESNG